MWPIPGRSVARPGAIFVGLSQEQRVYFQAFMIKQGLGRIHSHDTSDYILQH